MKSSEADFIQSLHTNQAVYEPGEKLKLDIELKKPVKDGKVFIEVFHLEEPIANDSYRLSSEMKYSWTWRMPADNEKGYLIKVRVQGEDGKQEIQTIAADASYKWSKFPRYGYLSNFQDMSEKEQKKIIKKLNRFHINGLQFYDFHDKHHLPLNGENRWNDIAGREVDRITIERYIQLAHQYNMKAMAYNLLYGAYQDAEQDGVQPQWGLYKDKASSVPDIHDLPDGWESDVTVMNPGNEAWQEYLLEAQDDLRMQMDFDGWHIDQLGNRGEVYTHTGEKVTVSETFDEFLSHADSRLNQHLVMNAVNQYGQMEIASSPVDFLYSELWDGYETFADLKRVIEENWEWSGYTKNTVLAAYMNYDAADEKGTFNEPGILLANAAIFSLGGAHIELGEGMLSKEYFPHHNLSVTSQLEKKLIAYYDFMTAYQNVLRDEVRPAAISLSSYTHRLYKEPLPQHVWSFSRQTSGKSILHFLNFNGIENMNWRDSRGTQKKPQLQKDINVTFQSKNKISRLWLASPDQESGLPQELKFKQKGSEVSFVLPKLEYYSMTVAEFEEN
ncbi:glycoside hydrolase family 66 protein [Fictibacillus iocasae]|uniref:Glycoside hydrolase family 66 protein n=1 Tax=Fictibacillus iocasae TaxID=2715437 RepID=A0ABW2NW00_9BACL